MILELYIDDKFKDKLIQQKIYVHGGFDKSIQYLKSLYGLKNKVWYIMIYDGKGRFRSLYGDPLHFPDYVTVKSIFPDIII